MIKLYGVSVSNFYNKVKLSLLEKNIAFTEVEMGPSEEESLLSRSPMGKILRRELRAGNYKTLQ